MSQIFRAIRMRDLKPQPWKNGGGVTTEIAVSPIHAALDAFDWRVSVAQVTSDGAFSLFPGIDRTLAVIEGRGLRLAIADRETVTLDPGCEPLSFPGDVPASASLIAGPLTDLNIMSRRGRFHHVVEPIAVAPAGTRLASRRHGTAGSDAEILLFCATSAVTIRAGDENCRLEAYDSCRIARGYSGDLHVERLEHFPKKWLPGSSKKMGSNKTLERPSVSERSDAALEQMPARLYLIMLTPDVGATASR